MVERRKKVRKPRARVPRPAKVHKNRKKDLSRRACRKSSKKWEEERFF